MTDVFISYSRRDKVFTQKLVDALKAANRDVWADWDSIPAASDWDAEIKEGIEKTDTVLFVLSPEWIKSNECRKEMIHAIQHGKRLLPILYLMPDQGQEVPPELAKINWVYMRDTDDFDKAFGILQSAMDTDLDWIKTHTRVQVRAIEWDKKKRDNSFTLRGKDLTDGEQFISGAAGKSPEPTPLQGEYILASRKDATRRQRITLAGVTVALVISIALGIVAWFQRQEAVKQAQISRVGELAALSISRRENDFSVSELLAVESYTLSNGQYNINTAKDALLQSAQVKPQLKQVLIGHSGNIISVAFSPDGKMIASGGADNTVILWDAQTTKPIGEPLKGHTNFVQDIAFSPDGKTLASASADNTIFLWDVASRQPIGQPLVGHTNFVLEVAFSPDGKTLASASEDSSIILWDVKSGQALGSLSANPNSVDAIAYSPDGKTLAAGYHDNEIILWDLKNYASIGKSMHDFGFISSLAFSPDGKVLASTSTDADIILWDTATQEAIGQPLLGHTTAPLSVEFSPDGKTLASGAQDGNIILWDAESKRPRNSLTGHSDWVTSVAFSPDGKSLVSGSTDKTLILWDLESRQSIAQPMTEHTDWVEAVAFSPDGKTLASGGDDTSIILSDVETGKPIGKPLVADTVVYSLAFSPDGKTLASGNYGNAVSLWDVKTGKLLGSLKEHTEMVYDVAFSPDGKTLASASFDKTIILWDFAQQKAIGQPLIGHSDKVFAVAFNPDGKILASGGSNSEIIFWDVETRKPLDPPANGNSGTIISLAFSPDGKILATGTADGTVLLWDAQNHQLIGQPLSGHSSFINGVAFSPDGKTLASGGADSLINLWDMGTKQLISTLTRHSNSVQSVVFSPDGKKMASGGYDNVVFLWNLEPTTWIQKTCQRAGRNFSKTEWSVYFPNEEYRKTCEQWTLETEIAPANVSTPTANPTVAALIKSWTPVPNLNGLNTDSDAGGDIVYQDDFSQKSDSYNFFDTKEVSANIENGVYQIRINKPVGWVVPGSGFPISDNAISVDIHQISGGAGTAYGLMCRVSSEGGYMFMITGDGKAAIVNYTWDGKYEYLSELIPVRTFIQGDETNSLSISCVNNQLSLSVNGEKIAEATDNSYTTGSFAFAAYTSSDPMQVNFDNLVVRQPDNSGASAPQATNEESSNILYQDDFSSPNDAVETWESDNGSNIAKNGIYSVKVSRDGLDVFPLIFIEAKDSELTSKTKLISGPSDNNVGFGSVCRFTYDTNFSRESRNGYVFQISGDGYASILLLKDGQYTTLMDWIFSDVIKQGVAENTFTSSCIGDQLKLIVNGETILETTDSTLSSGQFAYFLQSYSTSSPPTEVEFDNLVIKKP